MCLAMYIYKHYTCKGEKKQAVREAATVPCNLTFDLLTLKVVSESRVTWGGGYSVPILVLLSLSAFST